MPHIHEQFDFTIGVYIVFNRKVLLVNHPRYGHWIPIGGHIELNEDPDQALLREIQEEAGLQVEILTTKPAFISPGTKALLTPNYVDVHEANPPHHHINLTYFGRATNDTAVLSDEHMALRWFTLVDLADNQFNLSPAVQFYSREAIAAAS